MRIKQEQIGTGLTCQVRVVEIKDEKFAIKIFKDNYSIKLISKEINALKQISHPNIVKFIDGNLERRYIITELFNDMDLYDILVKDKQGLRINSVKHLIKQLAETLQYLHQKGFVHRDIKLENILLDSNLNLKLCDFGQAEILDSNMVQKLSGTLDYLAPELQSDGFINAYELEKADIYSLGVCIFIAAFAHQPYRAYQRQCHYWDLIKNRQWELYWREIDRQNKYSLEFQNLIEGMLDQDPRRRFTIQEVLQHPFLIGEWNEEFVSEIRERLQKQ